MSKILEPADSTRPFVVSEAWWSNLLCRIRYCFLYSRHCVHRHNNGRWTTAFHARGKGKTMWQEVLILGKQYNLKDWTNRLIIWRLPQHREMSLTFWLPHQCPICILLRPYSCYMPCPSNVITPLNELMKYMRPPLWSSGQSSWQQIQRTRVRFPALPEFLRSSGSGTGSTQPREYNWGATGTEK
jgi:hypothetical protein